MTVIGGFGVLLLTAIVVAALFTAAEKAKETKLINDGTIPPYAGYKEDEIKKLKTDGHKTIAIKRIRMGYQEHGKCSLKKAVEVYDSL